MTKLRLSGGTVYDPANSVDGRVADIWICDGRIVAVPATRDQTSYSSIDCVGRIVMPGGVDIHSHIVGPKVNAVRKMQPELSMVRSHESPISGNVQPDWRLGGNRTAPTIVDTGYKYLGLGYTTAMDAAIAPSAARAVHSELEQFPGLDAGFFTLVGNHHFILECAARGDQAAATHFLGWLLDRCGAFAPKVVNPGGVENFKRHRDGNARDLDATIDGFGTTPRAVIQLLARSAAELKLPHPLHIHCNNLGLPGNWQTTLETMRSLDGNAAHFAHIQFHSYGGAGESETAFRSQVQPLADYVNTHPEITIDVGQVLFGQTTSMTGDGPLGYYLSRLGGAKYHSSDTEVESGCGISPIHYKNKNFVHAMQWAIGLEWFLSVQNPWQVALSTDHPNGATFLAYPQIIRLLMDREFRRERIAEINPRVLQHSPLAEMDREYSLAEIAIITRAAPARMLGMKDKGHLGIGADADITVYNPDPNFEQMFQLPWLVVKGGGVVLHDGNLGSPNLGKTYAVLPARDNARDDRVTDWLSERYSFDARHFGIDDRDEAAREIVRIRP